MSHSIFDDFCALNRCKIYAGIKSGTRLPESGSYKITAKDVLRSLLKKCDAEVWAELSDLYWPYTKDVKQDKSLFLKRVYFNIRHKRKIEDAEDVVLQNTPLDSLIIFHEWQPISQVKPIP